jgi:hydroxymethylbilane synthase
VGQAAIAIQCREDRVAQIAHIFDMATARAVAVERAIQQALGGGCQTAFGAHVADTQLHLFHEKGGWHVFPLHAGDFAAPDTTAVRVLKSAGLMQ